MRHYSFVDQLIHHIDKVVTARPSPCALMRVNHSGEVSAQALYKGQAMVAKDPKLAEKLKVAAKEEETHLNWCETRVKELGGKTSRLVPLWSAGSFAIGAIAGLMGDKISLGFLAETEKQVTKHLDKHIAALPKEDLKSREILQRMREDEARHASNALEEGGLPFPDWARGLMAATSKIMTITSRFI